MTPTRRTFLKTLAPAAAAIGVGVPLLAAAAPNPEKPTAPNLGPTQWFSHVRPVLDRISDRTISFRVPVDQTVAQTGDVIMINYDAPGLPKETIYARIESMTWEVLGTVYIEAIECAASEYKEGEQS